MRHNCFFIFLLSLFTLSMEAQNGDVRIKLIQTSDVHGNYFPYNFIEKEAWEGSLARVSSFAEEQRKELGAGRVLLLDGGDILQGQPSAYYYNFIDTVSPHLCARMLNYMKYDGMTIGNHDIETGRAVYDRFISACNFPVLGANIVNASDSSAYLKPYQLYVVEGVRIVVLGMITPAIPVWLPESLWTGLRFEDMEQTAANWMKVIREKENPDVVVGVFHAGQEEVLMGGLYRDNASLSIARNVPGFDVVMMGHDHRKECKQIVNVAGDSVWVVDPSNNGRLVSEVVLDVRLEKGKVVHKQVSARLADLQEYQPDTAFVNAFAKEYEAVKAFVLKPIGTFARGISTRESYFGSSAFMDFIHLLQLEISGAEISFAAPLSFDAKIAEGEVCVSDMFNLYKYENMLYTMRLSGKEIKGFLEESYALWSNQMKSADDQLLLLKKTGTKGDERQAFANFSFNFDSAAGIIYTVDVTRPSGSKIHIVSMADGTPFDPNKQYRVALNSYRGNGGGELLTKGAGIPQNELKSRIESATTKDFRFYLMQYIEKKGTLDPQAFNQWKFIPQTWTEAAAKRDYQILFGQ